MPGKHALLSASGASRWMECTPSARLEETFPESSSTYADEGTFAHSLAELLLRKNLGLITEKKYGEIIVGYHLSQYYSHDMLDHVEGYVAFVMEKYNEEPGSLIFLEKHLDMSKYIEEGFGTGDVVILRPKSKAVLGIDLKYGKGIPVSAIGNKQGKLYLLGMLDAFDFVYDIDWATFIIYQPRLDSISEERNFVPELELWAKLVLKPAAALAYEGKGEYKPGDHCRFCRAKATCSALAEYSMNIVKHQFMEAEDMQGNNASYTELKPFSLLTDEEVTEVLEKTDLFTNWINSVNEYAWDQAVKHGKKWPGFKLVEGRSNRKYKDEELVGNKLRDNGYIDNQIYNYKLKGITEMTKLIGKLDFERELKDLIIKPPGAPTLVSVEDKRPEINSAEKIKAMFDEEV